MLRADNRAVSYNGQRRSVRKVASALKYGVALGRGTVVSKLSGSLYDRLLSLTAGAAAADSFRVAVDDAISAPAWRVANASACLISAPRGLACTAEKVAGAPCRCQAGRMSPPPTLGFPAIRRSAPVLGRNSHGRDDAVFTDRTPPSDPPCCRQLPLCSLVLKLSVKRRLGCFPPYRCGRAFGAG